MPKLRIAVLRGSISVVLASIIFGGSPACEKCRDAPGMGSYGISPERFRPGSVAAGKATTYQEWYDEMAALPCADACNRLVGLDPITVTSCTTSKSDASQSDAGPPILSVRCEWILHACDANPGCSG